MRLFKYAIVIFGKKRFEHVDGHQIGMAGSFFLTFTKCYFLTTSITNIMLWKLKTNDLNALNSLLYTSDLSLLWHFSRIVISLFRHHSAIAFSYPFKGGGASTFFTISQISVRPLHCTTVSAFCAMLKLELTSVGLKAAISNQPISGPGDKIARVIGTLSQHAVAQSWTGETRHAIPTCYAQSS